MLAIVCLALALPPAAPAVPLAQSDTIRLEVGSPLVDGRVYPAHFARNRVYRGPGDSLHVAEWTNELTLGDSAGKRVMRWVTRGTRRLADGRMATWVLRQTYDARTLAPYGYASETVDGGFVRLRIDGTRVTGTRRTGTDGLVETESSPFMVYAEVPLPSGDVQRMSGVDLGASR